jgi:hypothetical protein
LSLDKAASQSQEEVKVEDISIETPALMSDAQVSSVLSCLQAPVLAKEIANQVENNLKLAIERYLGL